jgi:hypothetical protein
MIRKPFKRYRSTAPIGGPSVTKQSFKEDCDVNVIVNRFMSGGELTHLSRVAPQYGDVSGAVDLQAALELVEDAWEEFEQLPARVRSACDNSPVNFEYMVSSEEGRAELARLGMPGFRVEPPPTPSEPPTENPVVEGQLPVVDPS